MFRVQNRLRAFLNPFLSEYRQKNGAAAHSFVQQPPFLLFTQYIIYSVLQNSFR